MVTVRIEYLGDLHCEAVHETSGMRLPTDAPKDNEGRGAAFSPTDLVAAALGTCMATIMGIVARRDSLDLQGMRVEVNKEMVADPARRIGRLDVTFRMPKGLSPEQRGKLERAAKSCPVHRSLSPETRVDARFEYPD